MPDLRLLENMLFNYGTSNRIDFRDGEIDINPYRTVYIPKPRCLRVRPPPLKDIHTLSYWKNPHIPTELLVKPKEIVRTNPRHIQQKQENLVDLDRENAQKTRPRLVMSPAISLDDIADAEIRNLLIRFMYQTTMHSAYCGVTTNNATRAPFTGLPAPANPITLEKLQVPYVSPEWRMESVGWDGRQLRAHCDHNKEFYLRRPLRCEACKVTAAVEAQRKLMREMKKT
ncbi:unnamed protein product [Danaus chrysippus]|uniref:(African queen) hypothetical protein n=1 Tax=Danaus chrysippus TaxID=151541 RepID=A0A8J2QVG1_9NEOP|nr:unnamed protein product [Danaus chrysippus]